MTDTQDIEISYLGQRQNGKDGLCAAVIPLETLLPMIATGAGHEAIEQAASLFKSMRSIHTIGGRYVVAGQVEDGRLMRVRSHPKWAGVLELPDTIVRVWEANHQAARAHAQTEKEHKKAAENTPLNRSLDELRDVYRRVAPGNRQAFLLMVTQRISRG